MKYCAALLCALLLALFFPQEGQAHRVNIFAYADGDAVQIECSFSKSQRVRNGRLTMCDAQTDEVLAHAVTDEQGFFRYVPEAAFLKRGHGLKIHLNAGEGHREVFPNARHAVLAACELVQTIGFAAVQNT